MRYPPELKEQIVKLAREGRSAASLAREYDGPAESTIRKWVKQSRESEAGAKVQTETEGAGTDPAPESGDGHPAGLFSQTDRQIPEPPVAPRPTALTAPDSGVLVTNDRNLLYMLAAGLLMPPSGFGGKHYRDTLSAFPGWLPLFISISPEGSAPSPSSAAVEDATGEARHLRPALVEVDLRDLGGMVQAHGPDGWAAQRLEDGVAAEESLLLFPAPLPVSRIRSVAFRSIEEQRAIEGDASDFGNVSFDGLDVKADQARFDPLSDQAWPPPDGPAERPVALAAAQAAGGVMAVLHRLANTGDLSLQAARCAFDPSFAPPDDSILRALPEWIATARGAGSGKTPRTGQDLFWGAVGRVVEHRDQNRQDDVNDALTTFYRAAAEGMEGELRTRARAVVATLDSLGGGLGGDTVGRMLDEHRKPTGRAAILFLLRRKSRELFELMRDYPQLEERDRLAAGILFGARDGWLKLPLALRASLELANAVTHRMAALAHRLDGSGCDLGREPLRVRPLREIFGGPGSWGPAEEEAALRLANELKWKDCYRTTVSLGRGSYQLRIESGSVFIDCADRPRVDTHLDRDSFFAHLSRSRIDANLEAEIRARLSPPES